LGAKFEQIGHFGSISDVAKKPRKKNSTSFLLKKPDGCSLIRMGGKFCEQFAHRQPKVKKNNDQKTSV